MTTIPRHDHEGSRRLIVVQPDSDGAIRYCSPASYGGYCKIIAKIEKEDAREDLEALIENAQEVLNSLDA